MNYINNFKRFYLQWYDIINSFLILRKKNSLLFQTNDSNVDKRTKLDKFNKNSS